MAASMCGSGGSVEWSKGCARHEQESGRGESKVKRDEGEDGTERRWGWPGANGLLYSEWDAVCVVRLAVAAAGLSSIQMER